MRARSAWLIWIRSRLCRSDSLTLHLFAPVSPRTYTVLQQQIPDIRPECLSLYLRKGLCCSRPSSRPPTSPITIVATVDLTDLPASVGQPDSRYRWNTEIQSPNPPTDHRHCNLHPSHTTSRYVSHVIVATDLGAERSPSRSDAVIVAIYWLSPQLSIPTLRHSIANLNSQFHRPPHHSLRYMTTTIISHLAPHPSLLCSKAIVHYHPPLQHKMATDPH